MSFTNSQTYRKRKVPEKRASSVSDSDSDDPELREYSEVRKIARLTPLPRSEKTSQESSDDDIEQPSSSLKDDLSDSDSNESEKCPICLKVFRSQTLGITDSCNHHTFCLSCLEEWSKTKNTCPVDRKEYESILVLNSDGKVVKQIPIKAIGLIDPWTRANQPTFCEICGLYNNEERMLFCDGCDMGFHMHCLTPQMDRAPTGMWMCNECWFYYDY